MTLFAGRYGLLSEIGRGGMAVVNRAHDTVLNSQVAVKTILSAVAEIPARRTTAEAQEDLRLTYTLWQVAA